MARTTEEEAFALDELVMKNPPKVSEDGKSGFFMKHKGNIIQAAERIPFVMRNAKLF